jgi:hypothetical protein
MKQARPSGGVEALGLDVFQPVRGHLAANEGDQRGRITKEQEVEHDLFLPALTSRNRAVFVPAIETSLTDDRE